MPTNDVANKYEGMCTLDTTPEMRLCNEAVPATQIFTTALQKEFLSNQANSHSMVDAVTEDDAPIPSRQGRLFPSPEILGCTTEARDVATDGRQTSAGSAIMSSVTDSLQTRELNSTETNIALSTAEPHVQETYRPLRERLRRLYTERSQPPVLKACIDKAHVKASVSPINEASTPPTLQTANDDGQQAVPPASTFGSTPSTHLGTGLPSTIGDDTVNKLLVGSYEVRALMLSSALPRNLDQHSMEYRGDASPQHRSVLANSLASPNMTQKRTSHSNTVNLTSAHEEEASWEPAALDDHGTPLQVPLSHRENSSTHCTQSLPSLTTVGLDRTPPLPLGAPSEDTPSCSTLLVRTGGWQIDHSRKSSHHAASKLSCCNEGSQTEASLRMDQSRADETTRSTSAPVDAITLANLFAQNTELVRSAFHAIVSMQASSLACYSSNAGMNNSRHDTASAVVDYASLYGLDVGSFLRSCEDEDETAESNSTGQELARAKPATEAIAARREKMPSRKPPLSRRVPEKRASTQHSRRCNPPIIHPPQHRTAGNIGSAARQRSLLEKSEETMEKFSKEMVRVAESSDNFYTHPSQAPIIESAAANRTKLPAYKDPCTIVQSVIVQPNAQSPLDKDMLTLIELSESITRRIDSI